MKELPLELDMEVTLEDPFSVNAWIEEHKKEINEKGKLKVFDKNYQFQVGGIHSILGSECFYTIFLQTRTVVAECAYGLGPRSGPH